MVSTTPKRKHRTARCPQCQRKTSLTYDGKLFRHYQLAGNLGDMSLNDGHGICTMSGEAIAR